MLSRILIILAACALVACESTPDRTFTYGARGAEIQAQRLVAQVYGKPADPLPYGGPDIDRPLARMKARWPALQAELERGSVGLTEDGDVALRMPVSLDKAQVRELKTLVKAENRDRDVLYRAMTEAIGHNGDGVVRMQPYTEDVFGVEWARQAPAGWWLQDHRGQWSQKTQ